MENQLREMQVTYICGQVDIRRKYGGKRVYKVSNGKYPWGEYRTTKDIIVFDNFDSSFPIEDMLNYLDGYPLRLKTKHGCKWAEYKKVYILSTLDISEQYKEIQREQPAMWNAFLRRIHKVIEYPTSSPEMWKTL